jgi:hypothetical protein
VAVRLADGRMVGVQVTEVEPYSVPGLARAQEKAMAKIAPAKPYFMWGQNDPSVVLSTIARIIKRKIEIAAKHSFDSFDEVWLLICAGVPEHGAVVSSFVMTSWLSAEDLNSATDDLLRGSKYNRCFLQATLGTEQAFYTWDRASRWEKCVQMEDICHVPCEAYVNSLMKRFTKRWAELLFPEHFRTRDFLRTPGRDRCRSRRVKVTFASSSPPTRALRVLSVALQGWNAAWNEQPNAMRLPLS